MSSHGRVTYGELAKGGFVLGLVVFALGATGELAIQAHLLQGQAWVQTLLFGLEITGIPIFLLSPFVFGIALPLIRG